MILALHHFLDWNFKMHQTHSGFYLEATCGTEMISLGVAITIKDFYRLKVINKMFLFMEYFRILFMNLNVTDTIDIVLKR